MPHAQTVMATWLIGIVDLLRRHGVDPDQLMPDGPAGAVLDQLAPTRQLQMVQLRRLWHRAVQLCSNPLLGLRVGEALPLQALNVTAVVIAHSGNLREALALGLRYQQVISNSGHLSQSAVPGGTSVVYVPNPCAVDMHPAQIDSVFAGILAHLKRCMPLGLGPYRIELPGTDPALTLDYERHFGCPVVLGVAPARVFFADAVLDEPWFLSDPSLKRLAIARADAELQARTRSTALVDQVVATVVAEGFRTATCASVARALGLSTRTLQRRLAHDRTTFRQLVEAARMDEALRLLRDEVEMPQARLAERLGYADPSALAHAVRAHFGMSPGALRRELALGRVGRTKLPGP